MRIIQFPISNFQLRSNKLCLFPIKIFALFTLLLFYSFTLVSAKNVSSEGYNIQMGDVNMGAGLPTSSSYNLGLTGGQTAPGLFAANGYQILSGFWYIKTIIPFSFTIDDLSIDFGTLTPHQFSTKTNFLTVSAGGAGGYQVTASESAVLTSFGGAATIPNTSCNGNGQTCGEESAAPWTDNTKYGFGYNMSGDDIPSDFIDSTYFRPFSTVNSGLEFDGTSDRYVSMDSAFNPSTTDFTLELWAYPSAINDFIHSLFQQMDGSGTGRTWIQISDALASGGGDLWVTFLGGGPNSSGVTVNLNQWTHVAIVHDNAANTIDWYINGQAGNHNTGINVESADGDFLLGIHKSLTAEEFNGKLDEVRLWNDKRTQTEIQENMYKLISPSSSNLAGYWRLNENAGTSTNDETANNNNGTLTNGPIWTTGYFFGSGVTIMSSADVTRNPPSNTAGATVTYQINISGSQAAGDYENYIIFIATPTY